MWLFFSDTLMLYTELIQLWDGAVRAVDNRDWDSALTKLIQISEPTSHTLFVTASVHLALGRLEDAIKALDQVIAKDERLAVAFFQRAAVHMMTGRLEQWNKATEILQGALQEGGRGQVDSALRSVAKREMIAPLLVPEGVVFRPRKQYVEELQPRDFLGKAEKPGYYEPQIEGVQDSRYMCVKKAYIARDAAELTVPAGAYVYVFNEEDSDGFVTVIYDGQRGLLPNFLLETVRNKTKEKRKMESYGRGIPLPPSMKPPTRPQTAVPPLPELPSLYTSSRQSTPSTQESSTAPSPNSQMTEADSVIVKVHYTYTIALSVPLETPNQELQERIAQKLGQPPELIRLRHKKHGSSVLTPLEEDGNVRSLAEVAEAGRATLWCQAEHPLANRTILYQMMALYDYTAQGPEDLEFSEGDTIDILSEVNEEWLEGHTAGHIGIFPKCFAYRDAPEKLTLSDVTSEKNVKQK
ncbi:Neutrophil cytosol factor 2 [Bagarius yarrelli]|uniref:Neutrophil cytosol factor 2 n=1 Tax=Bagarius yarrelli TaxID=175774 RepID=A0A556V5V4_BAGYA|nr:Neutrophil cytosol factor 2 [Bagarius yarrelli]